MRVLTKINGRLTVTEILEFEPIDDTTVLLNTPEHLLDIKITNINISTADDIAARLLTYGYVDLSGCCAEYDEEPEDDETECAPEEERLTYLVECTCGAETEFDAEVLANGQAYCPSCFRKLGVAEEEEDLAPAADATELRPREPGKGALSRFFSKKPQNNDPWEA